jgi:hypothetical protein
VHDAGRARDAHVQRGDVRDRVQQRVPAVQRGLRGLPDGRRKLRELRERVHRRAGLFERELCVPLGHARLQWDVRNAWAYERVRRGRSMRDGMPGADRRNGRRVVQRDDLRD